MVRRRVVITGLGALTPIGLNAPESWQAVQEGRCGIGPITQFDPAGMKVQLAAEVKGFDPDALLGKQEAKRMGRFTPWPRRGRLWGTSSLRRKRSPAAASVFPAALAVSALRRASMTGVLPRAGIGYRRSLFLRASAIWRPAGWRLIPAFRECVPVPSPPAQEGPMR